MHEVHPSTMMAVNVPAGIGPGYAFTFQTPDGNMLQVTCPPDAMEGQVIHVKVQPQTMPAAVPAEACGGVHPAMNAPQPQEMRAYSHSAAAPVTPMTASGVPAPPGMILSADDNNNNINNNTQPVAALPSSQQFTADQLEGCWFTPTALGVRASALRNRPDALAHLCSPR